jgi:hypothetical protein
MMSYDDDTHINVRKKIEKMIVLLFIETILYSNRIKKMKLFVIKTLFYLLKSEL